MHCQEHIRAFRMKIHSPESDNKWSFVLDTAGCGASENDCFGCSVETKKGDAA